MEGCNRDDAMRTRRSWRNQERLFRALFKPADVPRPEPAKLLPACFHCAHYTVPARSRSTCRVKNRVVGGFSSCTGFEERGRG